MRLIAYVWVGQSQLKTQIKKWCSNNFIRVFRIDLKVIMHAFKRNGTRKQNFSAKNWSLPRSLSNQSTNSFSREYNKHKTKKKNIYEYRNIYYITKFEFNFIVISNKNITNKIIRLFSLLYLNVLNNIIYKYDYIK